MIIGTVRDSVNRAFMECKWLQKKQNINKGILSPLEQQKHMYEQQLREMKENDDLKKIMSKLEAGEKLSPNELEYLKKHNPTAYQDYVNACREREAYKEKLRHCKTKEEAEELKLNKMGEFLSAAKKIANNPCIPKAAKLAELGKIMGRALGIAKAHYEFTKTVKYQQLPETRKELEEIKKADDIPVKEEYDEKHSEVSIPKEEESEFLEEAPEKLENTKPSETKETVKKEEYKQTDTLKNPELAELKRIISDVEKSDNIDIRI